MLFSEVKKRELEKNSRECDDDLSVLEDVEIDLFIYLFIVFVLLVFLF